MADTRPVPRGRKRRWRSRLIAGLALVVAAVLIRSCADDPATDPSPREQTLGELIEEAQRTDGIARLTNTIHDLSSPLLVPPGVTLKGDGAVLRVTTRMPTAVILSSGSKVDGVEVDARGLTPVAVSFVPEVRDVQIVNSTIRPGRQARIGISLTAGGSNVSINRTSITGVQNAIAIAGKASRIRVTEVTIRQWSVRALQIQGNSTGASERVVIDRADIGPNAATGRSRYPIMSASTGPWHRDITVRNSSVRGRGTPHDDPDRPGTADQISITKTHGVVIADNESHDGGERGINVSAADDVLVRGNTVTGADGVGIGIGAGRSGRDVTNVRVLDNLVENSGLSRRGTTPDASLAGIRMTLVQTGMVRANRITTTSGSAQKYGISLDRVTDLVVVNNTIDPALQPVFNVGDDPTTVRE